MFLNFRCAAFFSLIWVWICLAMFNPAGLMAQDEGEEADDAMFAELDINEDGLLSGKEVKTVEAYDTNEDGRVTKAEFIAGRARERGVDPAVEDEELFAERDISEDGFLSGKEKKGLEKYDRDTDGEITKDEFLAGRSAERKAKSDELRENVKSAEESFDNNDKNEDGRLSGTEIQPEFKSWDANGDNRITKEEYVAGYLKRLNAALQRLTSFDLQVILAALKSGDPLPLLAKCREDLRSEIDEPVLRFLLDFLKSEHGETKAPTWGDIEIRVVDKDDKKYCITTALVTCENGTIECSTTSLDNQFVRFVMQSSAAERFNESLYKALFSDRDFAFELAKFYTPRCEEFIKLIHSGKDEAAFASFHPRIQEKLDFEKAQAFFSTVRKTYGKLKSLELESLRTELDAKGKGENFVMKFLLTTESGSVVGKLTMEFDGLRAYIVDFAEEESKSTDDDDDVPAPPKVRDDDDVPAPPKVIDRLPAPPKSSDDE